MLYPHCFGIRLPRNAEDYIWKKDLKPPEDSTCSSAWWQKSGVRLEIVDVVNCL